MKVWVWREFYYIKVSKIILRQSNPNESIYIHIIKIQVLTGVTETEKEILDKKR